jgi:hypothetical protein
MTRKVDPDWKAAFSALGRSTLGRSELQPRSRPQRDPAVRERANGAASWSMGVGLLSIPTVVAFGLGAVLGFVATALGVYALSRETDHRSRAVAGIVLGLIPVLFVFALLIWLAEEGGVGACPYC